MRTRHQPSPDKDWSDIWEKERESFSWRGPRFNATHVHILMGTSTTSCWLRPLSLRVQKSHVFDRKHVVVVSSLGPRCCKFYTIIAAYGPKEFHIYPHVVLPLCKNFYKCLFWDSLPPLISQHWAFHLSVLTSNICIHYTRLLLNGTS